MDFHMRDLVLLLLFLNGMHAMMLNESANSADMPARRVLQSSPNLCFERIHSGSPLNLKGHPANKGFALLASQAGLIQLVRLPSFASHAKLQVVSTWLNLTPRVNNAGERGLLGIAFHPKYLSNGRFFVSYICDSKKFPDCQGPCACNAKIGCKVGANGAYCSFNTIVSEYRVSNPRNVYSKPSSREAKRILTFGRPFGNHNGGDIFFGPFSGYLLYTSGDGGNRDDPYNAAQAGSSMLGKILRLNVDKTSGGKNYSIPSGNPFVKSKGVLPEIYALGLRNPWRCSIDPKNGNLLCGDVGQDKVEEINVIKSGYNYGWSRFEGTTLYKPNVRVTIGKLQGPIFQYAHAGVNIPGIPQGGFSVTGGIVYRAPRNMCLQGKYIYNDLGGTIWVGAIYPVAGKRPSTTQVKGRCISKSAIPCSVNNGNVDFGLIWSWGLDSSRNPYMLSSNGVYRIVSAAQCGIKC